MRAPIEITFGIDKSFSPSRLVYKVFWEISTTFSLFFDLQKSPIVLWTMLSILGYQILAKI
ncbi:hypothetical protein NEPTK9_001196 [Candidatus Neptunochlamydia vexilliferae]|uniref:Transposase n=1 Tax=Candidatus Neptunichlamydia vexilliferae TaxID=1651774 RepID=A0ABS0B292_9BACT|nr:hypothetical protein [Candidatus Neptunochlamydia vexilliferae]